MTPLRTLVETIAAGDAAAAARMLSTSPELARERAEEGATRLAAQANYLDRINHYLYAGDTALHIAAAAYQKGIAMDLIARGADVHAKIDAVPSRSTKQPMACLPRPHGTRMLKRRPSPASSRLAPIPMLSTGAALRPCTGLCARVAPLP